MNRDNLIEQLQLTANQFADLLKQLEIADKDWFEDAEQTRIIEAATQPDPEVDSRVVATEGTAEGAELTEEQISTLALQDAKNKTDMVLSDQVGLFSKILIHANETTDIAADRIVDQLEAIQDGRMLFGKVFQKLEDRMTKKAAMRSPVGAGVDLSVIPQHDWTATTLRFKGGETKQVLLNQAE